MKVLKKKTKALLVTSGVILTSNVQAIVLKTNFDKVAQTKCEKSIDFNYYACLDEVRGCINHIASIKSHKMNMTEEKRAQLIVNTCILNEVPDVEPAF